MSHFLVAATRLKCAHGLPVEIAPNGDRPERAGGGAFLTLDGMLGAAIGGGKCPVAEDPKAGIIACRTITAVTQGVVRWVRCNGQPILDDTARGFTDGSPPGLWSVERPGQDIARRDSGPSGPPSPPPPPARDRTPRDVEIELLYDDGEPASGVRYELRCADGTTRAGCLDGRGRALVDVPEGEVRVSFPELDAERWSRKDA